MIENRKLRILVVTECFWPDIYAINDIVEKMVQRGHTVTVLTGLPDYTTSRIPPEYKHGQRRHETYKGAEVYRVSTIARRHGPIWRSLSYLSFVISGSLKARFGDFREFDVIYVWEVSPVTMAVPAITLKRRFGKQLFLYCMDIWPECVKAMNINEGTPAYGIIHAWSRRIYNRCDHIAVSSKPFFEYLTRVNGVPRHKMSYLPQFGDGRLLNMDTGKKAGSETTDLLFVGNMGKAQNLDCLIRSFAVFKGRSDVRLHLVGGGSEADNIRRLAEKLGLNDNVIFYGPKPFDETLKMYCSADACVLTLDGSNHIGDTLPGKLQTYMAAGKMILAAANGATREIIDESECGICVAAGDCEALGHAMEAYVNDKDSFASCGSRARDYFRKHFMEEQHFETLENCLNEMI